MGKDELRTFRFRKLPYRNRDRAGVYSGVHVDEFGPKALVVIQKRFEQRGYARGYCNKLVNLTRTTFRWGVSQELVPSTVADALKYVRALRKGKTIAPESEPRQDVPDEVVERTLPALLPTVAAMVQVQRFAAMRPNEVCRMKVGDIDRSGDIWLYRPGQHKGTWRGHDKVVPLGRPEQEIIGPRIEGKEPDQHVFSPIDALEERKVRDAANRKTKVQPSQVKRKQERAAKRNGEGKLVFDPNRTLPTARSFIRDFYTIDDVPTIWHYGGVFWKWKHNRYEIVGTDEVRSRMLPYLHDAVIARPVTEQGTVVRFDYEPFPAKNTTLDAAIDALKSLTFLSDEHVEGLWLGDDPPPHPPDHVIFGKTKNINFETEEVFDGSPRWFNMNALEFEIDPQALDCPVWKAFGKSIFIKKDEHGKELFDVEAHDLVMEFLGLLLTRETKYQKMLYMVGPPRCGKGIIARIVQHLVGKKNCVNPQSQSLTSQFGLQPLIGKSVAIISDARFTSQDAQAIIEKLLMISGEDNLTVDRKFKEPLHTRLHTRFMFMSNDVPRLPDASGAIASRFMIVNFIVSFLGREDKELEAKLLPELPAIFNYVLAYLKQLRWRGRFLAPESSKDAVELMEALGSPVGQFVKDWCDVGDDRWESCDSLWEAWKKWCEGEGIHGIGVRDTFFRNLKSAVPGIVKQRRSETDGKKRFWSYKGVSVRSDF